MFHSEDSKLRNLIFALACAAALTAAADAHAVVNNVLGNPGFEEPLAIGANWNQDPNRGITVIQGGAPEGNRFLRMDEGATTLAGPPAFIGVFTFQVASGVNPGDRVAFSGLVRVNALTVGEVAQLRIEFQTRAGALISATETSIGAVSANFSRFAVSGTAPDGTSQVAFVIRIQPSTAGNAGGVSSVDFDSMQGSVSALPVVINAGVNGQVHNAGDLVMISTRILNVSADRLNNVELVATPTGGLSIHRDKAFLDGNNVNQREGSIIFDLGSLNGGQESLFAFPVLLTSGVVPGRRYEISLFARTGGTPLSDIIRIEIDVEPDPLFQMGTIIGKVFNDMNENAMQDPGEKGIPNVRLATEQGMMVYTDQYGKYHLPAVPPGRHVVKADYHTLPEGTQFVTEESYLTNVTEGLLCKVNFAVKLPKDDIPEEYQGSLNAHVIQELDRIKPELSVEMDPPVLKAAQGMLEREAIFRIHTNYGNVLKEWKIEVRDEMGKEVWSGLGRGTPPEQVRWDGKDNGGNLIEAGDYAMRLIVADDKDHEDWTRLTFFRVQSKLHPWKSSSMARPYSSVGFFNMMEDGKRSIPLEGRTAVRVQGRTPSKNNVLVNNQPVKVGEDGRFESAMFMPDGKQKIEVSTTTENGETLSYQKDVEIKDHYLFMVGLAEEQMGANKLKGNIETAGNETVYRDGFYKDGKVAYYLKGKIKGKFLISSSYDSEKDTKAQKLFTSLDPEAYYPVYGDDSEMDYSANDTQSRFYVLIEKDRSFVKYGSFHTDFTDTELSTHSRTMSGAKVHFESLGSTRYGDSKRGLSAFHSTQKQLPDHNEFLGTGGSLFYLRKRFVVQGSEQIRVEVRDKLTGVILLRKDLVSGTDYEIDYDQGRIILNKPLTSIASVDTIIQQGILDGNHNFLVVDYEYHESKVLGYATDGIRGFQHFSDHVKVGGTYIRDQHPPNNQAYDLRGVDATIKAGMNTKVTAEYAETQNAQLQGYSSANGGLTFFNLGSANAASPDQGRNGMYVIRAQTRPFKKFDISAYVQRPNPFFNNADTAFSQGEFKKYGLEANYRMSNNFTLRYRNDNLHLNKRNLFATDVDNAKFHTFQGTYDAPKIFAQGEYRHSNVEIPEKSSGRLLDSLFSINDFDNAVGGKLGYRVTEKYMPYTRGQATFSDRGKTNNQLGFGIEARILDKSTLSVEENFGNIGDSTQIRFDTKTDDDSTAYANIKMGKEHGQQGVQTTLGSSHVLDNRSRVYSEKEYSEYRGSNFVKNTVGYERTFFDDRLGANFTMERNNLDRPEEAEVVFFGVPTLTNAFSTGLTYKEGDFLKATSKWEFRRFTESSDSGRQWLTYNNVEYKVTKDLELFSRLNISKTNDFGTATFSADFVEFNTGASFRPVEWDRFNALARYTFLSDNLPIDRYGNDIPYEDLAHIIAIEGAYDFNRFFQLVEKFAFKLQELTPRATLQPSSIDVFNYLWITRLNYHITRKWDFGVEYRILTQQGAGENSRHGFLFEVDREILDYTRFGIGYNFTDFTDDIRKTNSYQSFGYGPFVRLTGKF